MVGIEEILVRHYEVLNLKTQDSERFGNWDSAETFYNQQIERHPTDEIKLVAVVCESWCD